MPAPRIVILDAHTANPGDLSWADLAALGDLAVHERTPAAQTVARAAGAAAVLTNKTVLGAAEIGALPDLRYVGVLATGYNVVDLPAAREHGVTVTNVFAYSTDSVAQVVFAHLLELTHQVGLHSASVHAGDWVNSPDFAYWRSPLVELAGLNFGIVGFGGIGQAVARVALAFGMNVLVHTRTPKPLPEGCCAVALDTLFRESDVLSLHCPLTPETQGLVNAERLALMKPTAFLINTSRGPVLDEAAVAAALNEGRLAGAGVDVLSTEPPAADNPLLTARNCFITPHLAWATQAARRRLIAVATANVRAWLEGTPQNVVS